MSARAGTPRIRKSITRRPRSDRAGRSAAPASRALEMLLQAILLLLTVFGFLFSVLTCYGLTVFTARAVLFSLSFVAIAFVVYTHKKHTILVISAIGLIALIACLRMRTLIKGLLTLLTQALTPMHLNLPGALAPLAAGIEATEETALATTALLALLLLVTMLAGFFIVRKPSVPGLALSTLPWLAPAPFYALAPAIAPFFCLFAAYLTLYAYRSAKRMPPALSRTGEAPGLILREEAQGQQHRVQRPLSFFIPPLVLLAVLLASFILPAHGYTRPESIEALQQDILSLNILDLTGESNDGLTHGSLRKLSAIRYTGEVALKIRVSETRPLYLRDFAGVQFSEDGWVGASSTDYARIAESFAPVAPQNLHAAASAAGASQSVPYTLSVKNVNAMRTSVFTPNGLITRAEEIDGVTNAQDTALTAARARGVQEYTLTAYPCNNVIAPIPIPGGSADAANVQRAYQSAAGSAMQLPNAQAAEVQSAASAYIDYVFSIYTTLPEETRQSAAQLCSAYGLTLSAENGALDVFSTCRALYRLFSERCTYAYSPAQIPSGADFTTYFLNESREGYCVHFATAATVLLRTLGVPARYAEGYIAVSSDYAKPADSEGYIEIEDTHAHAWVEVFDPSQLEWIPVEMTPGDGSDTASASENSDAESNITPSPSPTPTPTPTPTATPESDITPVPDEIGELTPSAEPEAGGLAAEQEPTPTQDMRAGDEADEPSPSDDGGGAGGAQTDTSGDPGSPFRLSPWLWIPLCTLLLLALLLYGIREAIRARQSKRLADADTNAAVLYAARLSMQMLQAAGQPAILPLDAPEEYAQSIAAKFAALEPESLARLLALAQRARFSGKVLAKRERDEAVACLATLLPALAKNMKKLRRAYFRFRFPPFATLRRRARKDSPR